MIEQRCLQVIGSKLRLGEVHEVEDRQTDERKETDSNNKDGERTTIEQIAIKGTFVFFGTLLSKRRSGGKKGESGTYEPPFGGTELGDLSHGVCFEVG